jgi:hypothetical protein
MPTYTRAVNLPQVKAEWGEFLTHLRGRSSMLASQLRMADIHSVDNNAIELRFFASGEASMELVQKADNLSLILKTLRDHYKANLTLRFSIDPEKENPVAADDKPARKKIDTAKLVESSPRLKMLMEKVDGEIIGIKDVTDENH